MPTVYDETGKAFELGPRFAGGGQGEIFPLQSVEGYCVKIYHARPDTTQTEKLRVLRARSGSLGKIAALPISLAFSDARINQPVGAFLPFIGGQEIYELYGTRSRLQHFPNAKYNFLVHTACNLAIAFDQLHAGGIIVGDINEQNIKVLPDATIRFIDCDSFQITDGAKVYTSDVGTPIWTPPELQGRNLIGVPRSVNHDAFGLAQLIFLLLFVGRHPFSGRPRGARHLQPDEAVREYAFAFAPESLALPLLPPPGSLALSALPAEVQQLFFRAFLRGAERLGHRGTAKEWKENLERFSKALTTCGRHPQHVFWREAAICPWCALLQETGVDVFPPPLGHHATGTSATLRDDEQIARLGALRSYPFAVQQPPVFADLTSESLPPEPTDFWSGVIRFFSYDGWKHHWLDPSLNKFRKQLYEAEETLRRCLMEQNEAVAKYQNEFARAKTQLQPTVAKLTNQAQIRREIENHVANQRWQLELNDFLQQRKIRHATIPDIKAGRKLTLQSYGIETAADVSARSLANIRGFGPVLQSRLLNWRREQENRFRYDPQKAPSPVLKVEIERRFQEQIKKLKDEAAKIESSLQGAQRICADELRKIQARASQVARTRDQAKTNIAAFETRLRQ